MDGRAFLDLARQLILGTTEAHWRGAAGRAYYALMLECREALRRWGFAPPSGHGVHSFVRLRFVYAHDLDLKEIGYKLEKLGKIRNFADYEIPSSPFFKSAKIAQESIDDATDALALLDQIEADPPRRAAAVAAINTAWP